MKKLQSEVDKRVTAFNRTTVECKLIKGEVGIFYAILLIELQ